MRNDIKYPFRNIISTFEKEREMAKKSMEQAKKQADGYIRERDLVRKELVKCNSKENIHHFRYVEKHFNAD